MFEGITNWVEDKVAGYAKTGIQAGGTLAGNAVGGVGSLVENAGRSAGDTVSGGIGGVGGKIQNYGDGIKRSMSADGPASGGQKKTAVKPTTAPAKTASNAQKTIAASNGNAKKTIPSTGNAQTAAPTGQQKAGATQKPGYHPVKTNTAAAQNRSKSAPTQPLQNLRNTAAKANAGARPQSTTSRPGTNVGGSGLRSGVTNADGKTRVSPESMPRAGMNYRYPNRPGQGTAAPTRRAGNQDKSHDHSDPLGIGENFGDMSKGSKGNSSKPQSGGQFQVQSKAQQAVDKKPSASDPLALGEEINKIGQKK